jgi:hypothetical protein
VGETSFDVEKAVYACRLKYCCCAHRKHAMMEG